MPPRMALEISISRTASDSSVRCEFALQSAPLTKSVWNKSRRRRHISLAPPGGTLQRRPFGGEQILHFPTWTDCRRFRALTEKGQRSAIIGGGFIGSEFAAAVYQGPLASHMRELRWD